MDQPEFIAMQPAEASPQQVDADAIAHSGTFPPALNGFGMVGQIGTVQTIIELIDYSLACETAFPDKAICGGAGAGKSTTARAIARRLTKGQCILLNGGDFSDPQVLIDAIADHGLFDDVEHEKGVVSILPVCIFVDEFHAVARNTKVVTFLLSAMDEERQTTFEGVRYDFKKVTFLLATTDYGKLSLAFRSRAEPIYLRPYSLQELAAIVWLHGKRHLEDFELPYAVCVEIGARMRANPRRAVNALKEAIIPHAFAQLSREGIGKPQKNQVGEAITVPLVARYFDAQGIDLNGVSELDRRMLTHLNRAGCQSEQRIRQALGITNQGDFVEVEEYLSRLGLLEVVPRGRQLTAAGRAYLAQRAPLRRFIAPQHEVGASAP